MGMWGWYGIHYSLNTILWDENKCVYGKARGNVLNWCIVLLPGISWNIDQLFSIEPLLYLKESYLMLTECDVWMNRLNPVMVELLYHYCDALTNCSFPRWSFNPFRKLARFSVCENIEQAIFVQCTLLMYIGCKTVHDYFHRVWNTNVKYVSLLILVYWSGYNSCCRFEQDQDTNPTSALSQLEFEQFSSVIPLSWSEYSSLNYFFSYL